MYLRRGEVMVYDIGHVLALLNEHPWGWLKETRATQRRAVPYKKMEQDHDLTQALVDDFICYTINSFQAVWVSGFNSNSMSTAELAWFNLNERARTELWLMLNNLANKFAGEMVGYARTGNLLILHVPTD